MDTFFKAIAGVLIAIILCLSIEKQGKDHSAVLTLLVSCMVMTVLFVFLKPVFDFIEKLEFVGNINSDSLSILIKAVGVGMLTEVTAVICADGGKNSLSKTVQMLGTGVIIWISIPLFDQVLTLLQTILSEL